MKKIVHFIFVFIISFSAVTVLAHQPIVVHTVSNQELGKEISLSEAVIITDPGTASVAVYDALVSPDQVALYSFISDLDTTVPVEALVPVRRSNTDFRPWVGVIGTVMTGNRTVATSSLPFLLPRGYLVEVIPPLFGEREIFLEPYSLEKLYHNREETITLKKGERYYLAVFSPDGVAGDFAVSMGTVENFTQVSKVQLAKNIIALKLGIVGGRNVPVSNFLVLLIAVFAVGVSAGIGKLFSAMILLGLIRPWWTALALRTQSFFSFIIFLGVCVFVGAASIVYHTVGISSLAPVTIIFSAFSMISAVYLFILGHQYRWLVVRIAATYEKAPSALWYWRVKTMLSLFVLILSALCSLASVMWYSLIVA
ncbi:MAG: hypothetical protein WC757_02320 [Candidatus Paceibacterota bacterium]|jgi:hypothetical protein